MSESRTLLLLLLLFSLVVVLLVSNDRYFSFCDFSFTCTSTTHCLFSYRSCGTTPLAVAQNKRQVSELKKGLEAAAKQNDEQLEKIRREYDLKTAKAGLHNRKQLRRQGVLEIVTSALLAKRERRKGLIFVVTETHVFKYTVHVS